MNSVERVKAICKSRKIPISRLEKDLGFSNGYISQLRKGIFPGDRLASIAKYLDTTTEFLLNGEETEKTPTLTAKDERSDNSVNIIKMAGRDGSYTEKRVSDEQLALFKSMLDQMKPVDDDV